MPAAADTSRGVKVRRIACHIIAIVSYDTINGVFKVYSGKSFNFTDVKMQILHTNFFFELAIPGQSNYCYTYS